MDRIPDVVAKVEEYKSLFSSTPSVMVLEGPELYTVYVGACKQWQWQISTIVERSSTTRSYDPVLFCKCDRLVWVVSWHVRK